MQGVKKTQLFDKSNRSQQEDLIKKCPKSCDEVSSCVSKFERGVMMCTIQVHCLVEHGAVLERSDNGGARDRTSGCQNPALVASLLKKASKTGTSSLFPTSFAFAAARRSPESASQSRSCLDLLTSGCY